jgi:hypothetical protein
VNTKRDFRTTLILAFLKSVLVNHSTPTDRRGREKSSWAYSGFMHRFHGKLFLIEEIENDIHPKALKAVVQFIRHKSERHQQGTR